MTAASVPVLQFVTLPAGRWRALEVNESDPTCLAFKHCFLLETQPPYWSSVTTPCSSKAWPGERRRGCTPERCLRFHQNGSIINVYLCHGGGAYFSVKKKMILSWKYMGLGKNIKRTKGLEAISGKRLPGSQAQCWKHGPVRAWRSDQDALEVRLSCCPLWWGILPAQNHEPVIHNYERKEPKNSNRACAWGYRCGRSQASLHPEASIPLLANWFPFVTGNRELCSSPLKRQAPKLEILRGLT